MTRMTAPFGSRTVDELTIEDERSFRHVGLYADLKEILRRHEYHFRVLPETPTLRADRALLLNLTFWTADAGGDVLVDDHVEADVVAHAAWHHLAARVFETAGDARPSASALFLAEAIASAFDIYLVGRLLGHAPRSSFLETQVPAMAAAADAAGLPEQDFERLLESVAADPDGAFADLRELLYDAMIALSECRESEQAHDVLVRFEEHRFAALLHRYEISNWLLYARAYGDARDDPRAREVDLALRGEMTPLQWLTAHWVDPAIAAT